MTDAKQETIRSLTRKLAAITEQMDHSIRKLDRALTRLRPRRRSALLHISKIDIGKIGGEIRRWQRECFKLARDLYAPTTDPPAAGLPKP